MGSNLRSKQYVFRNQQLSKVEYHRQLQGIDFGSHRQVEALKKEYHELLRTSLHKYADILKSVNCTGDNITDSKNAHYSFDIQNAEDVKYCDRLIGPKDCYDVYGSATGQLNYDGMAVTYGGSKGRFILIGDGIQDSHYVDYCLASSFVFGCIGLKKKSYCILNKQYTKEEYEKLVPKIIEHMNTMPYTDEGGRIYKYGEFFPPYQYAYNESMAQEYFPLTQDGALARGYRWREPDHREYKVTLQPADLPDHIKEVKNSILQEIVGCEHGGTCNEQCTTAFKITPHELQFYQQMNISIPHLCPNCRHYQRLKIRNPHKLWHRSCMCNTTFSHDLDTVYQNTTQHFHGDQPCPNEFETSYSPDRPETIYCEQCYQAEIL